MSGDAPHQRGYDRALQTTQRATEALQGRHQRSHWEDIATAKRPEEILQSSRFSSFDRSCEAEAVIQECGVSVESALASANKRCRERRVHIEQLLELSLVKLSVTNIYADVLFEEAQR